MFQNMLEGANMVVDVLQNGTIGQKCLLVLLITLFLLCLLWVNLFLFGLCKHLLININRNDFALLQLMK